MLPQRLRVSRGELALTVPAARTLGGAPLTRHGDHRLESEGFDDFDTLLDVDAEQLAVRTAAAARAPATRQAGAGTRVRTWYQGLREPLGPCRSAFLHPSVED